MKAIVFALLAVLALSQASQVAPAGEHDWSKCLNFKFGTLCGEVYLDAEPTTNQTAIGVRVLWDNVTVFDEGWKGKRICADTDTLLMLLSKIPMLAPYAKTIEEVMALFGFLPADVFDVCLQLDDVQIAGDYVSGCSELDLTLVCWKNKCLYKGKEDLGCFKIHI